MGAGSARSAVFTIPVHLPFLDSLVAGLLAEIGDDVLALSRMTILLPTRRSCRALREAFLRASKGRAQLLPRMRPLGDLDDDELALDPPEAGSQAGGVDIPPALPELRRRLLLTRLVLEWGSRRGTTPLLPGQAAALARELARFLDDVHSEDGDFANLAALAPAEYAEHWQLVLKFLAVLTEHWPRIVAAEGGLDAAARRNAVLAAQTEAWRHDPPPGRIIAAGLTGALPAIADLLAVIAALPRGAVVLAGLDRETDPTTWTEIADDPTHPQHVMAQFLRRLELTPDDVRDWPAPALAGGPNARAALIAEILRPAAATHEWRGLASGSKTALDRASLVGMCRLDCGSPQEEAGVIALLLRERLERPGETAALVTPDRDLARRVASELRRWRIEIDDSAGLPLNKTPPGIFLRLVLDLAASGLAPVPLLAALKHPLAACGGTPVALRAVVRRLETYALRGPRPAPGFTGLAAAIGPRAGDLHALIVRLQTALAPLLAALAAETTSIAALVAAHVGAAEALAGDDSESGAIRLWREEAGEVAARFVAELIDSAGDFPALRGADYPALFEALIADPVVRPNYGRHPRLAIWGLLEARLQQADLIVLGGLNEGTWPANAASDPWLSRPMRQAFGLSPPERRIGVAAHDFAQGLGAREVILTRASRVEGAPTVPSRWLLRLDTVLRASGLEQAFAEMQTQSWPEWQRLLDQPARPVGAMAPPAPRPPVAARPRRLSVTEIETWMRDPYAIYARHVLRLRALDPLDADPGAAERGMLVHRALELFVERYPGALPEDAGARLVAIGEEVFGAALSRPGVWAFWWPRFLRVARWFVALETTRRGELADSCSEVSGGLILAGPAGPFELVCKADRIDRRHDGGLIVIDYKTGAVPRRGDVDLGFAPQLPLEAAIAEAGGLTGIAGARVVELAYWRLGGGDVAGEIRSLADSETAVRTLVDGAIGGLGNLIARFDHPATPYRSWPRPEHAPRFTDYAQLARVKEWSLAAESE
jgi:ATP-dependent helicase/nuclease subunit B